ITVDNTVVSLPGLNSLTDANLTVTTGGSLTLAGVTSYTTPSSNNDSWISDGTGSVLNLSTITSLTGGGGGAALFVNGQNNGHVNLGGVTTVPGGAIFVYADGATGQVDLSKIVTLHSDANNHSLLRWHNGGTVVVTALTTLNRADITVDNT